jgi:hypothetical protein
MLLHRLHAAFYLAIIIVLSILINLSKIAPETYNFVGAVSFLAVLYAFIEPDQILRR